MNNSPLALLSASFLLVLPTLASADTVIVSQVGLTWSPPDVTIHAGDTVRWVHAMGTHTVTEGTDGTVDGNEAFHADLTPASPAVEFTFDATFLAANPRPGNVYDYFCAPHFAFGMTGTVTVLAGEALCFGDGSGTACPCANESAPGSGAGCLHSFGSAGALGAAGIPAVGADSLVLSVTGLPPTAPGLYFQGTADVGSGAGAAFGDGLRCVAGSVVRLGTKASSGGASSFPEAGDPSISVKGMLPAAGGERWYQVWYRNAAPFCTADTFNLTNAIRVSWGM